jgi:hypothetical protein
MGDFMGTEQWWSGTGRGKRNRSTGRETLHSDTLYTTNPMYCDALYYVNFLISVLFLFKTLAPILCSFHKKSKHAQGREQELRSYCRY